MNNTTHPWVLGIASSHNGAACLLKGDEVVVAIQEERLLRQKRADHPAGQPSLAVRYCLDYAGIEARDLAAIGVCCVAGQDPRDDVHLNPQLQTVAHRTPVFRISHHFGHAVGAFATSGFDSASILVIDGNGSPWACLGSDELATVIPAQRTRFAIDDPTVCEVMSLYSACRTTVAPLEKHVASRRPVEQQTSGMRPFFSLGRLFENVGWQIFGEPLDGPGKVMGLAPYGRAVVPPDRFFDIRDGEIVFRDDVPQSFAHDERWPARQDEYRDLAASVQAALESALLWVVRTLRAKHDCPRLCYAGGVALNSVANERLIREGGFDRVFIMPAAEDSGTSIGAAYHALWSLSSRYRGRRLAHDSVGRCYDEGSVRAALDRHPELHAEQAEDVVEWTAERLAEGQIVGWFQGGSELGPRALGQRSILADPRRPDMKDVLNSRVKFREAFRPYAPVVLRELVDAWFDTAGTDSDSPSMLRVMPFRPERRKDVPAVVHTDGTGRVQTVTRDANGRLRLLLEAFFRRTGVPLLLNTSFNIAGEPIVETPGDALRCFLLSGLDACVMGSLVVTRTKAMSIFDYTPVLVARWLSEHFTFEGGRSDWARRMPAKPFFYSLGEARLGWRVPMPEEHLADHIRIGVGTQWGPVVHIASPELLPLLRLIDGRRTGWQLLDAIAPTHEADTKNRLRRQLSLLARTGVIDLTGGTSAAKAPDVPRATT